MAKMTKMTRQPQGERTSLDQALERMRENHRVTLEELETANAELKSAARAVREGERRLRLIAEHVDDLFILRTRDTQQVAYISPAFERIFGQPVQLFEQRGGLPGWIHREDRARVDDAHANYLRGDPLDLEYRIHSPDGVERLVRVRGFPVEDQDTVMSDVLVIQDITDERHLEQELQHAQKMEALGTFASSVAHDFNNVLQGVLGCINIARAESTAPQRARDYLDKAADAVRRGGDLAGLLMAFARKQPPAQCPLALDTVLQRMEELLDRLVGAQIKIELDLATTGCSIAANAVQIEQILMNLVANARDAMPGGGTVSIQTDLLDEQETLRLIVQDTGAGIDACTHGQLFDPFFTTKPDGTGLGLATVYSVTSQLGGRVTVKSQPGEGSTFTLYFPCISRGVAPDPIVGRDQPCDASGLSGTVLLVEDDPTVRATTRHQLEELGLVVLEAEDGAAALRLCEAHEAALDLLISDITLPDMNGPQLVAQLLQRCPVLLITANPELVDTGLGSKPEFPVLQKPFTMNELAHHVVSLLRCQAKAGRKSGAK